MSTCDTCKFWDAEPQNCLSGKFTFSDENDVARAIRPDELHIRENERLSCSVFVGPKFGCIHHQEKKEAE